MRNHTNAFVAGLLGGLLSLWAGGASAAPAATAASGSPSAAPPAAGGAVPAATVEPPGVAVSVTLVNPLGVARPRETIALGLPALTKVVPGIDLKKVIVLDVRGGAVLSQLVDEDGDEAPDELVFQADFAARETKTFRVIPGKRALPAPADFKVYGRFVRERHDDFAWENDRIAHRAYGPDLETYPKDPLVSSGIDTWVKRVPKLVVNEWYMTDDYHQDHGEGADFYAVGKSRGCGGIGIWTGGALAVSRNFTTTRVLANGPIRLVFELSYAPWDAGGAKVGETKRVTLDAGSPFNHIESTFSGDAAGARPHPLTVGIGIAKHPGNVVKADLKLGWRGVWEPLDGGKSGHLGCAVLLPLGSKAETAETAGEYLLVTPALAQGHLVYYVGTAWDQATSVVDLTAWQKEAQALSARLAAPIKIKLASAPQT
jgi:unsaturated rhamnogalacturonyl hydrolase